MTPWPSPVVTPYTGRSSATARCTVCCAARIRSSASSVTETGAASRPIASSIAGVSPRPESATPACIGPILPTASSPLGGVLASPRMVGR